MKYFQKEHDKWPESRTLMTKMIANSTMRNKDRHAANFDFDFDFESNQMMRSNVKLIRIRSFFCWLSCTGGATVQKDYTKFNAASPHSILIVPVVNKSVDVTAPDYFLSTIAVPVAEQGYYVFPVNLVKRVLEDTGCRMPTWFTMHRPQGSAVYSVPTQCST